MSNPILTNINSEEIDITGWVICDSKNRILELKGKIKPGETNKFGGKSMGKLLLANSGGSLRIVNQELKLVDYVRWSRDDVRTAGEGQALIFGYVI